MFMILVIVGELQYKIADGTLNDSYIKVDGLT